MVRRPLVVTLPKAYRVCSSPLGSGPLLLKFREGTVSTDWIHCCGAGAGELLGVFEKFPQIRETM